MGYAYENEAQQGICKYIVEKLPHCGSGNTELKVIKELFERYSVSVKSTCDYDESSLYFEFPAKHFDLVYPLIVQKLLYPIFPDKERIDAEISVWKHSIPDKFLKMIGLLDNNNMQNRYSASELSSYYETYFSLNNLSIYLSGNYSKKAKYQIIEDFNSFHLYSENIPKINKQSANGDLYGNQLILIENNQKESLFLIKIPIDIISHTESWYIMKLFASWLGEENNGFGFVQQQCSKSRALCTKADVSLGLNYMSDNGGYDISIVKNNNTDLYLYFENIDVGNAHFVLKIIEDKFNKLTENGLSKNEFEIIRKRAVNMLKIKLQNLQYRSFIKRESRYFGSLDIHEDMIKFYSNLSLERFNAVLAKHILPGNFKVWYKGKNTKLFENAVKYNLESGVINHYLMKNEIQKDNRRIENRSLAKYKIITK